jgi:hypothetical protein
VWNITWLCIEIEGPAERGPTPVRGESRRKAGVVLLLLWRRTPISVDRDADHEHFDQ